MSEMLFGELAAAEYPVKAAANGGSANLELADKVALFERRLLCFYHLDGRWFCYPHCVEFKWLERILLLPERCLCQGSLITGRCCAKHCQPRSRPHVPFFFVYELRQVWMAPIVMNSKQR